MKKLIALMLALVMVLSLGAAAFAAEDVVDDVLNELSDEDWDALLGELSDEDWDALLEEALGEFSDELMDEDTLAMLEHLTAFEEDLESLEIPEFTTLEEGKLIISTSPDFPPYEYLDDDDYAVGIEMDILSLIADALGVELVVSAMDFDSALLAVQQGKSDMVVSGCTVTEDRKLVMNFTDSYTTAKQVIVVPVGSDVTLDTLGDYDIGTQRGTTGYIYTTDDYGEDHVIGYDTYTLAFQALQNGQVDCIVLDDAVGYAYVDQIPGLEVLDTEYVVEDYAFGVDKDNAELLEAVNLVLNAMMDEGLVQDIIDAYISD